MKQLLIALSLLAPAISPSTARGQGSHAGHEYSPLVESTVNYKNWTLPNLMTDKQEDLRKLMEGKKLVMVVYFAQWCGNWRNEAPVAAKLYDKYKAQGFQIIGVSEYAFKDEVLGYFGKDGPPYPVVIESQLKDDKQDTAHYAYRQLTGDKRNWGSPWNIFLEPGKVNKTGEVLTEKAWVVNGELIEEEVDKFIASKVGAATAAMIEPCKN
jgi:thiol-disulfide isomerase/thioredoxin